MMKEGGRILALILLGSAAGCRSVEPPRTTDRQWTSAELNDVGVVLERDGELKAARDAYRDAVKIDPKNHVAWTNLGNAQRKLGEPGRAQQAYRTALRLQPAYHPASRNLSLLMSETP